MPAWEVIVQIRKDGVDLAGFPYRRTIETNEGSDFNVTKAGGDVAGAYSNFPGLISGSALRLFIASTDQPVSLILGAVAAKDGIISLLAGGLVLVVNGNENAPAGAQVQINNVPANTANLKGGWGAT